MGIWDSISKSIAEFAPTIAKAILPGPVGGLASLGIQALTEKLGLTSDADPKDIEKAVKAMTHQEALELKKEDNAFTLRMEELGVDRQKLFNSDRSSARDRDLKSGDGSTKKIAWVFIVGFFLSAVGVFVLLGFSGKLGLSDIAFTAIVSLSSGLLGQLGSKVDQILSFFFGDSENGNTMGKELTKTIAKNINK